MVNGAKVTIKIILSNGTGGSPHIRFCSTEAIVVEDACIAAEYDRIPTRILL